jgi:hypothetical protein
MSLDYSEIIKERLSISALIYMMELGEITESSGHPANWTVQQRYNALAIHGYMWTGNEWLPANRIRATTRL